MLKKMQKAMREISYFQKLKEIVGEEAFREGVEIAKSYLRFLSYTKAKRVLVAMLCRTVILGDVETAKKYAVAIEVLEDFKRNEKA